MLPQFNISNFITDWTDGRAFAALTNKCYPGMFPNHARLAKDDDLENLQTVFSTVKKKLGISANFIAKKLTSGEVDELQVMTFVMRIRGGTPQPLPEEVVVSGPGIVSAVIGKETYFTVNTAQGGPGVLSVQAAYEDGRKVDYSSEREGKTVFINYTPYFPGKITIDVRWSGKPVPHSPFTVTASDTLMVKIVNFDHHKQVVHINELIELTLDTGKAGHGTLTALLRYGKEAPIPVEVTWASGSIAKLRYTALKPGQPVLRVFWNGQELPQLTVTYTVLDKTSYHVATKPESRIYRLLEDVKFSVESRGGSVNALHMTAIMEGDDDIQVPIQFRTIEGSAGHAVFHPTLPGNYRIEVACVDKLVEGSPFHVDVVDPTRCKVLGSIPTYLELNQPYTFDVKVKQAGNGTLTFECDEHAAVFETNISPPDQSGVSKVLITPLKEGKFLVRFKFEESELPGSPFRIFVCDPSRCRVSGEVLEKKNTVVGKLIRFQVKVDPIENLKPTITAKGPSAQYTPEIREMEENVYTVRFSPWEVGTHDISVMYGDFHVPNSPFLVSVVTLDSGICSATGSGLQKAFTGIPAQFVVLAKEEGLLKDGTLQIKVRGVVNNNECKVRARDNKNGSYNVAYMVHNPGAYLISVLVSGKPIAGSPFRLTAMPGPTANKCHMDGPVFEPNAVLTIGSPIDFVVDTSAAGVGKLSVKAVGPGGTQARVYLAKGSKKGVHNVKLDPIRHGKYRVSVKWSDVHIPGSPFMLKIYPGADASKCKVYGPGLEDGAVGEANSFTIETRDAGAGTLKVRLHGVRDAFRIEIKPASQQDIRTLKANYNARKAGDYVISIKWSEKHVPGSPFRVKITGDGELTSDSQIELKATPRDETLNPIAEEVDEANWGDEQEERPATSPDPVPPKRKKKRKKSNIKTPPSKGII